MEEKKLVFDLEILYDDGTKENIPMLRNIQYNTILYEELLVKGISEVTNRVKKFHTNPIKITIKNIRNVFVRKNIFSEKK